MSDVEAKLGIAVALFTAALGLPDRGRGPLRVDDAVAALLMHGWSPPPSGAVVVPGVADDGHSFEVRVRIRGASTVVGDPRAADAPTWADNMRPAYVRAHNLPAALRAAAELPLSAWFDA